MHVLGDVVARDRRSDEVALRVDATGREFSYRDFCTTAWKAGHALSHCGVHAGARVALDPDPAPQPLLTLFGAACLGARVTFDTAAESRAVLVPAAREGEVARRPERKVVVYGDAPDDPGVVHWERTVWSENPVRPPGERDAEEVVLDGTEPRSAGSRPRADDVDAATYTHREVLAAATSVADATGIDSGTSVALRAPLTDPRAVVAGVVAPLARGGTVVLPDGATDADVVVGADGDVRLDDVPL
ncbi:class I adenylate-forming enzyme family protein [Haloplanus rubicundus]|uniref:Acetyl-CoA synthetase n=1 Tax=Haloplanus rubicundus TaxID=1547898 RepID=A0A345EF04_9EURY|nr:acetyl-CoA synthetase [Haloplanus rubicundus]AXG10776.1 acetyl-CoA synthetase [Haloplanus rubicundus]